MPPLLCLINRPSAKCRVKLLEMRQSVAMIVFIIVSAFFQRFGHLPAGTGTPAQHHVAADQPRKQHRFRGKESEHPESDNVRSAWVYFVNRCGRSLHG